MAQPITPPMNKGRPSSFRRNVTLLFSLPVFSWALYDFANTIFSMNIISRYFSLWVVETNGAPDILYSAAVSVSMFFVVVCSPLLGVLIDWRQKKVSYVRLFALTCIGGMIILGLLSTTVFAEAGGGVSFYLLVSLLIFVVCNFAYNSSLVFYNAMLPDLGKRDDLGRISGWGVAIGYCGTVVGLLSIQPFVLGQTPDWLNQALFLIPVAEGATEGENANAFLPTALVHLLFALPLFIFGKNPSAKAKVSAERPVIMVANAYRRVFRTFKEARKYRGVFMFLVAYFFFMDAINTVIAFMSVYAKRVIGFNDAELTFFLIGATLFAIVGAFIFGYLTDWIGSKRTLYLVLGMWVVALTVGASSTTVWMFWVTGVLAGIGMGSASVASRKLLVELSPAEKQGEFFGLFSLSGKMSAILGPLVWGAVTWFFQGQEAFGNRMAIVSLIGFVLVGWFFLSKVKVDTVPSKDAD